METQDAVARASVTLDENSQPIRASCVHFSGEAGYSHLVAIDKSLKWIVVPDVSTMMLKMNPKAVEAEDLALKVQAQVRAMARSACWYTIKRRR